MDYHKRQEINARLWQVKASARLNALSDISKAITEANENGLMSDDTYSDLLGVLVESHEAESKVADPIYDEMREKFNV